MSVLVAEKITKSYSEKVLFDKISLAINEGDKIGLIGINGTGKSTLLRVIAGLENPDEGRIICGSDIKIEYLFQSPEFKDGTTVLEHVFKGNTPVMKLIREYEDILQMVDANPGDSYFEKKMISLSQKMDHLEAWSIETEAKRILTKLGIRDFKADVGKLSGGQRKRVAMAGVLITPADLLILDEPTNHIDNETVDWLESYINKQGMTRGNKIRVIITVTVVMVFGFVMMHQIRIGQIILGIVWIVHILYFSFGVKNKASNINQEAYEIVANGK
jgi:ATP-binding cassette subfamily F protein uup